MAVYYRLRKLSKIAGMEYVGRKFMHPHVFRHSFVMNAINKGVDMKYIQRETGHASIQMLGNYMSLRKEDIERNRQKMWE
jgi:site-specific recombinase XerD